MDLNNVTLEITTLIIAFDHYDVLVSDHLRDSLGTNEEHQKILNKNREHIEAFFNDASFYSQGKNLKPLDEVKEVIKNKLADMKTKEIHDLVEKMEKDARKMKKLYRVLQD
jgi:CHASE3 domain sensor protein